MWFIIKNEYIEKVSMIKENENQVEITNYPSDILDAPSNYRYVDGEFIEVINLAQAEEIK